MARLSRTSATKKFLPFLCFIDQKAGKKAPLLWTLCGMLMVDGVEVAKAVRVVTIAWALWHNSNELRNGGKKKSGKALVQWAVDYLTEY